MKRIAVWNTAFLGDALLTLPLLQSLRLRYPEAAIDFYVRGGLAPLFSAHPALSAVYAYDKRRGQRGLSVAVRLGRELAERRYDLWLSAHGSLRSSLLALISRAGMRVGYAQAAMASLCFTHRVERGFAEREEIERLLQLLAPLGEGPLSDWPELVLGRREEEEAERFFAALPEGPVLGIHPGSVWPTKRWPAPFFAEVGRKALAAGANVLLFAGPGEEEIARRVRDLTLAASGKGEAKRLHDLSGRLSLPLLAASIARLSCYLGNDSGPLHLAWCRHVPVTAIFGPTVRALGFFPRGSTARVFETELACRPCGLHGHKRCPLGHHRCMTGVRPEEVWPDLREKLGL